MSDQDNTNTHGRSGVALTVSPKWNDIAKAYQDAVGGGGRKQRLPRIRTKPARTPKVPRGHNHNCLIKGCSEPVFYDERSGVWWSLCIACLHEKELGPFFKRIGLKNDYD